MRNLDGKLRWAAVLAIIVLMLLAIPAWSQELPDGAGAEPEGDPRIEIMAATGTAMAGTITAAAETGTVVAATATRQATLMAQSATQVTRLKYDLTYYVQLAGIYFSDADECRRERRVLRLEVAELRQAYQKCLNTPMATATPTIGIIPSPSGYTHWTPTPAP